MEEEHATSVPSESDLAQAVVHTEEGKKALAEKDYRLAQDAFAKALEISVTSYGDLGVECAELYVLYGNSLLATAKQEAVEFFSRKVQQKIKERSGGDGEDEEDDEEDLEADADDTLGLAFEIFETARVIYSSQPDKKLEVARVHLKLGKVNEEGDNLSMAITEYEQALELRQAVLGPDHPLTIKVHSVIAGVFCLLKKRDEALHHYTKALELLKQRISKFEKEATEGKNPEEKERENADLQRRWKALEEKIAGVNNWDTKKDEQENGISEEEERVQAFMKSEGVFNLAGPSDGVVEQDGFSAPTLPAATASVPVVHNLGVFGRSKKAAESDSGKGKEKAQTEEPVTTVSQKRKREEAEREDQTNEKEGEKEEEHKEGEAGVTKKARVSFKE